MFKVLLVDDDRDILEMLAVNFREAGFKVWTAEAGIEALHQARRVLPDAIVLDVLLPDLDGMSVCEILRQQPSTAAIPVLLLTAMGGQISRLAGFESGATDYVVKPIRPRDLVRRVLKLIPANAAPRSTPAGTPWPNGAG
ncbi:MAG: response regulator [Verrucomicrobiota bacterium]